MTTDEGSLPGWLAYVYWTTIDCMVEMNTQYSNHLQHGNDQRGCMWKESVIWLRACIRRQTGFTTGHCWCVEAMDGVTRKCDWLRLYVSRVGAPCQSGAIGNPTVPIHLYGWSPWWINCEEQKNCFRAERSLKHQQYHTVSSRSKTCLDGFANWKLPSNDEIYL